MKCLTIRQPYASLIASGAKTIEARSWPTDYRGPLLIHAASRLHSDTGHLEFYAMHRAPLRVTLCIVDLVDVRDFKAYGDRRLSYIRRLMPRGTYAWVLENPQRVPPIQMSGQQGLFDPPSHVLKILGF